MLKLRHLKDHDICPSCQARVKGMKITGKHTNGQQFESVTFDCGGSISWSPNFSREEATSPCMRCAGFVGAMESLTAVRANVRKHIHKLSISTKTTNPHALRFLDYLDDHVNSLALNQFYKP